MRTSASEEPPFPLVRTGQRPDCGRLLRTALFADPLTPGQTVLFNEKAKRWVVSYLQFSVWIERTQNWTINTLREQTPTSKYFLWKID